MFLVPDNVLIFEGVIAAPRSDQSVVHAEYGWSFWPRLGNGNLRLISDFTWVAQSL